MEEYVVRQKLEAFSAINVLALAFWMCHLLPRMVRDAGHAAMVTVSYHGLKAARAFLARMQVSKLVS